MYKEVITNYMDVLWNKKKTDLITELFSEDVLIHTPMGSFQTPKDMAEIVRKWHVAIPDMKMEFLHIIEEDNVVIVHWKAHGTHRKDLNALKATNQPIDYKGVTIFKFDGDKVVEQWAYVDSWLLDKQTKYQS